MGRKRHNITPATTEVVDVKVTMKSIYAGPDGTATAGTVIDATEAKAKEFIEAGHARPFDPKKDARAPQGIGKAPEKFE